MQEAIELLGGAGLDVLVNNAGVRLKQIFSFALQLGHVSWALLYSAAE